MLYFSDVLSAENVANLYHEKGTNYLTPYAEGYWRFECGATGQPAIKVLDFSGHGNTLNTVNNPLNIGSPLRSIKRR